MAASSIRFGPGSTKEVGMDFKNMGAKRVCIVTDTNVAQLDAMKQATEGLAREGVEFTVFDKVRTEPKDSSYVFPTPFSFLSNRATYYGGLQDQGSHCFC
jgi:hydroxyacid-oxoacid transhydrogenase